MSFKYRFILSFVLLEVFFIVLIVSVNFFAISNSSKILTQEKIESNTIFLEQLVKVPVSIYDLATLDDLVSNSAQFLNSIVVLDSNDRVLSSNYNFTKLEMDDLLKIKENKKYVYSTEEYEVIYKKLFEDDIYLGSLYIVFDLSSNLNFIKNNKEKTILIILLEILVSIVLSFLIGQNLTRKLTSLSDVAKKIGESQKTSVPFKESKDEIGILSRSMDRMQNSLHERNSELKENNKVLTLQKKELIEANKLRDQFLANMSHELKTPLNSINIISDVMIRNKNGNFIEKDLKNLSIVNKCGKDLLYLINDILDISKIEAGEIILNKDTIDIKKLSLNIYDMIQPQVESKGIDFDFIIDDNVDYMYSDQDRINQIIKNLLSNAIKFTENGKVELIVKDLGSSVKFIVKDEGIGIPQDIQEHIFDRFKQVDGSTTRKYGGTGLGLAISKELTTLLKGELKVTSKIDVGSTFELIIPKHKELIKDMDLRKFDEGGSSLDKKSIYVLNDDPVIFFKLFKLLSSKYKIINIEKVSDINTHKSRRLFCIYNSLKSKDLEYILKEAISLALIIDDKEVDKELESLVKYTIHKQNIGNFERSFKDLEDKWI